MATMTDTTQAREQAQAQLDSIRAMVLRLSHATDGHDLDACDIARECARCGGTGTPRLSQVPLDSPDEECDDCDGIGRWWKPSDVDGLDFDDYHDEDAAREAIYEDPLSVEVRSGWVTPGSDMTPQDFQILLCTGGPAVRIMGELSENGEPSRAWLECQDWFTPWEEYHADHDTSALLTYAGMFFAA